MGSTTPVVIVGAGGHGRELFSVLEACAHARMRPRIRVVGFLDDEPRDLEAIGRLSSSVLGPIEMLRTIDAAYIVGIGAEAARERVDAIATGHGRVSPVIVHPAATVGRDVELGPGTVLTAGARLTTNVRTGRHTHVNQNATVAHDCLIGSYVTIGPGATLSGGVDVGDRVQIGTGANVLPGCTLGHDAVVGAGAVVTTDVEPGSTVVGVPARPVRP
jgi:sugar O-acyltransferase (sialic acid O-acetyltransferase NeuD family)